MMKQKGDTMEEKEKTGKLPEGWELRDNFQPVFLNKYGYYEFKKEKYQRGKRQEL